MYGAVVSTQRVRSPVEKMTWAMPRSSLAVAVMVFGAIVERTAALDGEVIATTGGASSGVSLALAVVARSTVSQSAATSSRASTTAVSAPGPQETRSL